MRTAQRTIDLCKQVKNLWQHFRGNTDTVVRHPDHGIIPLSGDSHANQPASVCIFRGIAQQIHSHLFDTPWIAVNPERLSWQKEGELMTPGSQERTCGIGRTVHDAAQFHPLRGEPEFPFRHAADVEQIIHQPDHLLHLPLNDPPGLLDDRIIRAHLLQDAQSIENRRERIAQLVGQQCHELLFPTIGFSQSIGTLVFRLQGLISGQVVHHPGKGVNLPGLVVKRSEACLAPESSPIFAEFPANAIDMAIFPSGFEFVFGLARDYILR